MTGARVLAAAIEASHLLLSAALLLAFVRLVKGPRLPDRVVALDLIAMLVVGIVAVHVVATGVAAYLDVAIVLALIAFLSTVAFAYYLARRYGA